MRDEKLDDLVALLAVAKEQSFTRAAAKLGVSQSALSQTIRGLEAKLGLRLLSRTTRRVAPTEAGQRLIDRVGPHIDEINVELAALAMLRSSPAGTVRLAASENAVQAVLWPALRRILPEHPDVTVEISVEAGLTDIVAGRFDAGIRPGEVVSQGMISVRIGPDLRMAVVGSPTYFETRSRPETPPDLTSHRCINLRLPTHGGLYAWDLEKDGREVNVRTDGQLIVNTASLILNAAIDGFGLAYLTEQQVAPYVACGQLVRVLDDWCPPFPGYHLYYPDRRPSSSAFTLLLETLRYRK